MDQLVLVGAVNVFSQSIIIGVTNTSGGSCNAVLGKSLVVDNADVLRSDLTPIWWTPDWGCPQIVDT